MFKSIVFENRTIDALVEGKYWIVSTGDITYASDGKFYFNEHVIEPSSCSIYCRDIDLLKDFIKTETFKAIILEKDELSKEIRSIEDIT